VKKNPLFITNYEVVEDPAKWGSLFKVLGVELESCFVVKRCQSFWRRIGTRTRTRNKKGAP